MNAKQYLFMLWLIGSWSGGWAQTAPASLSALPKKEADEIRFLAKKKIEKGLADLLNTLTFEDIGEFERDALIKNSFLPNANQVFFSDEVILEDDIEPEHKNHENVVDVPVEKYLRNVDLFYAKTAEPSISFGNVVVSPVQIGDGFPYVKVFFTSNFKSKHAKLDQPYQSTSRVAELRAEKENGKWQVYIIRLAFLRPGEGLAKLGKPTGVKNRKTTVADSAKTEPLKAVEPVAIKDPQPKLPDAVPQLSVPAAQTTAIAETQKSAAKKTRKKVEDKAVVAPDLQKTLTAEQQQRARRYRTQGWLSLVGGIAGLAGSYLTYSKIQADYQTYMSKVDALNADYDVWREVARQPTGGRMAPLPLAGYGRPGIYAAYGAGAVGVGLTVNGVLRLMKAGRVKRAK
ncbi:hypothetical protein [Spirosoma montaniterrae]|uniref:SnoaL-like domain-containing protein n=1 Tax=Spirosoma montaniterrae TaxID=1178516 RepID=A0A1P9X1V8_9BACT|nr:hypothetical protein [Spirosoma montaniterrae]AQG81622.1 hypothetical protein AWR27_21305 [Spirosoma montaniterrae]